jgi:hypothetical protein
MIHLIDDWYLDSDDRQYILIEWNGKMQIDKNGKNKGMSGASYRYIRELPEVFDHLLKIITRRKIATLTNITEIIEAIKSENDRMSELFLFVDSHIVTDGIGSVR